MAKDRTRVLAKFQNRVSTSGQEYAAGVNQPKRDWLTSYQKAQPRMKAALQAALNADKPLKGAQRAGGTANWQSKAADKGARNYQNAAADAAKGYDKNLDDVLAAGDAAAKAVEGMPDVSIQDRINRSAAAQMAISKYWQSKKG